MRRLAPLAPVFASVLLAGWSSAALAGGGEDEPQETAASAPILPAEVEPENPVAASAAATASSEPQATKRRARARGRKPEGHVVADAQLRAEPAPRPSGRLNLYSIGLKEEIDVNIFNEDGSYNVDALAAVNHVLRCKRTDTERPIEPRLLVILSQIEDHFGKRIDIVSGYRNQRKQTSNHFKGSASDIRIQGVRPKTIRTFAETLDAGGMGIGYYPRSLFVHVDVRPPPSYRWIDYARPNPNSPDTRPPRGWKRKKLQS